MNNQKALLEAGTKRRNVLDDQAPRRRALQGLAVLATACVPFGAFADTTPVTGEFQVGGTNSFSQNVARSASGEVAFVWQEGVGSTENTYVGLYDSTGAPLGSPILVDSEQNTNAVGVPAVAMDDDGDVVVSWASGAYPQGTKSNPATIYAQLLNPDGSLNGTPITVGTTLVNRSYWTGSLAVAMDADGDFVETWSQTKLLLAIYGSPVSANSKIYARAYSAGGTPKTAAFEVDTFQGHIVRNECTNVAMDAAGDFTVAWTTASVPHPAGSDVSKTFWVRAQRYSAAGTAVGAHILVSKFDNTTLNSPGQVSCASIGVDTAGDFGLAWSTPDFNVLAQTYTANGKLKAGPVTVASYTSDNTPVSSPVGAMDAAGDFAVIWGQFLRPGSPQMNLNGQFLNLDGSAKAPQFTLSTDPQYIFNAAVDASGEIAAIWENISGGLTAQLFTGP